MRSTKDSMAADTQPVLPRWLDPSKPFLPAPRILISEILGARSVLLLILPISLLFGAVATFRSFGFDLVDAIYPEVADGWGIWYWFAHLGFSYTFFFFTLNLALSVQILLVAFPGWRKSTHLSISILFIAYMILWNLFGQARWGMAIALLAPAAVYATFPVFMLCGVVAFLIHKGMAGGIFIFCLWRLLKDRKHALKIAVLFATCISLALHFLFGPLLALAGYENYAGWEGLPSANTPLKYYYFLAVLALWAIRDRRVTRTLFILTLVFLPSSYFNALAGRAYTLYSIALFSVLVKAQIPRHIRLLIALPYVADLGVLLFASGFYL
jgi:hypothetical protein